MWTLVVNTAMGNNNLVNSQLSILTDPVDDSGHR